MGAWGHGIYSNDTALDFLGDVIDTAFEMARDNEDYLVVADLIKENTSPTENTMKNTWKLHYNTN